MNIQISDYAIKINELHNLIGIQMRTPIKTAIEIGNLLSEVKENVGHGNFLIWIQSNCNFDDRTAQRYIKLFKYKIDSVSNLQEAYKQIEQIESKEKETEIQRKNTLIFQYIKTGKKPDGWDRSLDYEYNKRLNEEQERDRRINELKQKEQERLKLQEEQKEKKQKEDEYFERITEEAKEYLNDMMKNTDKRQMYLSSVKDLNTLYDVIEDYLHDLNESNKLESLNNIIKWARNKANELHRIGR